MLQGDALDLLPSVLSNTSSPLCIFHSTCLFYWSADAKAALEHLLAGASRDRDIYRVGIEPAEHYDSWYAGRADTPAQSEGIAETSWGDVTIARYSGGSIDSHIVAHTAWDGQSFEWID